MIAIPAAAAAQGSAITLSGFIVDSISSEPVVGVELELDGLLLTSTTTSDGSFVLEGVGPGQHALSVHKEGFFSKAFQFRIPADGARVIDMGVIALAKIAVREITVHGIVSDASSRRAIDGVRIALNDTVIARTEVDGGFAVRRQVAEGVNRLTVVRLGYETLVQEFEVEPTSTEVSLMITLRPQPTRMSDIVVETDAPGPNKKLEGFFQRRETEVGSFLGPEEIEQISASRTSDILRRIPALSVRPLPGRTEIMINRCIRHLPRIYVDGLEIPEADVDLMLNALDVAAVEVYTSGAQIPVQFNRPAPRHCGVVLIWTKGG